MFSYAPDLGSNSLCFGNSHRVAPATQAADERILAINPHPDVEAAVVLAFHQPAAHQIGSDFLRWTAEEGVGQGWDALGDGLCGYGYGSGERVAQV